MCIRDSARSINLARALSDGEQIIVTSKQMQKDLENQGSNSTTSNDQSFSSSIQNEMCIRDSNRIGQGIEFDYCCVHASYALHDAGFETIMVNCNPETVSTDYDTSDRIYFEPLTYEDVMDIVDVEQPDGVVVTLGGQTPLKLARDLENSGMVVMGTKPEAIDLAEDRDRFSEILDELHITLSLIHILF